MNRLERSARLPASVGSLVDLAFTGYASRAGLYVGIAALVLVAEAIAFGAALAARGSLDVALAALQSVNTLGDALLVAVVALGVVSAVGGEPLDRKVLLRAALRRWPAVIGATMIAQVVVAVTQTAGGLGPVDDPSILLLAPVAWLLWGAVGFAGPCAALSGDRAVFAIVTGFVRALGLSLYPGNLARLSLVALATVAPLLLEDLIGQALAHQNAALAAFVANAPLDAIITGPLTALQAVFILDFARRIAADRR